MEFRTGEESVPNSVDHCYQRGCPAIQLIVHEALLQSGVIYDGGYFAQRLKGSLEGFKRGGLDFTNCSGPKRFYESISCRIMGSFEPNELAKRPSRIF